MRALTIDTLKSDKDPSLDQPFRCIGGCWMMIASYVHMYSHVFPDFASLATADNLIPFGPLVRLRVLVRGTHMVSHQDVICRRVSKRQLSGLYAVDGRASLLR